MRTALANIFTVGSNRTIKRSIGGRTENGLLKPPFLSVIFKPLINKEPVLEESKSTKKLNIAVVLVGTIHRDHGSPVMLLQQIAQLVKLGCNIVYCDEMTSDLTLPFKIMCDAVNCEESEKYRAHCHTDKKHAKSYFRMNDLEKIQTIAHSREHYDQILWINSHPAEKNLAQYLLKAKIPYQGLEPPMTEWKKIQKRFAKGSAVLELEQTRTEYMARTLTTKIFPTLKQNTLIICNVGVLHSHRIAAKVLDQHAQTQPSQTTIKVFPMICYSNYIDEEERNYFLNNISEMRKADSENIVRLYSSLPAVQNISLTETPNGEAFESEEFCKVFHEASQFVKAPKFYFIPNVTPEKRKLLEELKQGEIIERSENACVLLRSCDLTAERRATLGIERRLIKFGAQRNKQLAELNTRKTTITLEETCYPSKYLVTFPPNELLFIEDILHLKKAENKQGPSTTPGQNQ